jgi:hypothetical protein
MVVFARAAAAIRAFFGPKRTDTHQERTPQNTTERRGSAAGTAREEGRTPQNTMVTIIDNPVALFQASSRTPRSHPMQSSVAARPLGDMTPRTTPRGDITPRATGGPNQLHRANSDNSAKIKLSFKTTQELGIAIVFSVRFPSINPTSMPVAGSVPVEVIVKTKPKAVKEPPPAKPMVAEPPKQTFRINFV